MYENFIQGNKFMDEDMKIIDEQIEKLRSVKSKNSLKSTNKNFSNNLSNKFKNSCESDMKNLDSKVLKEPLINRENFIKNLSNTITSLNSKNKNFELKLMEYPILKEIIDQCGSYPEKFRNYIWKYLLSLPGNNNLFEKFSTKGIHPFFTNLEQNFPIKDKKYLKKLQQICSLIAYWSPHVGNVYFLPNMIFPFIKAIKGDDLFIFELLIAFISSYCQYWFEFYPGGPLNHIKICEKIIEKEAPNLHLYFKKLEKENSYIKLSEIIWRLIKNNFSETLIKESWLQYMDFIITYSHKPEIILYFATSLIMKNEGVLLKCRTNEELEIILFGDNKNSKLNLLSVLNLTRKLLNLYSKFQLHKYLPHIPFPENQYPIIDKFPLDFLETTAKLREELFKDEENFKSKTENINEIEKKFKDLLKKEEMIQKSYQCLIHKEKEKGEIMKRELDLIMFQKNKFYDELKNRKLDKVDKLGKIIEGSIKLYDDMHTNELNRYEDELRKRKMIDEFDLKQRLQQEELNNLEFEANRKMLQMLNLRNKDEEERKLKYVEEYKTQDRECTKKLLEEKWKLEDEEMLKKLENVRNLKEFELIKKKEGNDLMFKQYTEKLNEFEQNLMIQEIERERRHRLFENEIEMNKLTIENQIKKRNEIMDNQDKNELQKIFNDEMDMTKKRKKEQNEILSQKLKENLNLLEEEEKALMEYDQSIKKNELDLKMGQIRKKGELNALQEEKYFQDKYLKIEEQKRIHLIKKGEIEIKKANFMNNLNNLTKNDSQEIIREQRENFDKFKSIYDDETNRRINDMKQNVYQGGKNQNYENNYNSDSYYISSNYQSNQNSKPNYINIQSQSSDNQNPKGKDNPYLISDFDNSPSTYNYNSSIYNPLSSNSQRYDEGLINSNRFSVDTQERYQPKATYNSNNRNFYENTSSQGYHSGNNYSNTNTVNNKKGLNTLGSLSLSSDSK